MASSKLYLTFVPYLLFLSTLTKIIKEAESGSIPTTTLTAEVGTIPLARLMEMDDVPQWIAMITTALRGH